MFRIVVVSPTGDFLPFTVSKATKRLFFFGGYETHGDPSSACIGGSEPCLRGMDLGLISGLIGSGGRRVGIWVRCMGSRRNAKPIL